jgi:ribosome-binding ATPase YchF (GTP1/OBG family)
VVAVSAAIEEEMSQLEDADRAEFLAGMGLDEPGPEPGDPRRLRPAGHADLLHRRREGSPRLAGAGRVDRAAGGGGHPHRFEKGFIRAETIAYDDFIRYRGESGARDAGRLRLEGKEYVVQEGDVLHFRFNV